MSLVDRMVDVNGVGGHKMPQMMWKWVRVWYEPGSLLLTTPKLVTLQLKDVTNLELWRQTDISDWQNGGCKRFQVNLCHCGNKDKAKEKTRILVECNWCGGAGWHHCCWTNEERHWLNKPNLGDGKHKGNSLRQRSLKSASQSVDLFIHFLCFTSVGNAGEIPREPNESGHIRAVTTQTSLSLELHRLRLQSQTNSVSEAEEDCFYDPPPCKTWTQVHRIALRRFCISAQIWTKLRFACLSFFFTFPSLKS